MRFGLALPHYDFSFPQGLQPVRLEGMLDVAHRAESLGFDSVWMSDHFFLSIEKYGGGEHEHGALEPFTALAAVAATTAKVRLGTLVASAPFRHPSLVAQQAASLDRVSDGRFELGLGAGWYEPEFIPMGFEFGALSQRFETLERVTELVDALRGGDPVESVGPFVLEGARVLAPVSERWPLWIGAKGGPRAMRLVARSADGWNTAWRWTPDTYASKLQTLEQACEAEERDMKTIRRSVGLYTLIAEGQADLGARWRQLQAWTPNGALDGVTVEEYAADTLTGTPEQIAETVARYEALGVEEIIINLASMPFAIADLDQLDAAATSLLA